MAKPWAAPLAITLAVLNLPAPAQGQGEDAPPTAPAISEAPQPPVPDAFDVDVLPPPAPESAANTPEPPAIPEALPTPAAPPAAPKSAAVPATPAPTATAAASKDKPKDAADVDSAIEELSDVPPAPSKDETPAPVATNEPSPEVPVEPTVEPAPEVAQASEPAQSLVRRRNRRIPTYQQIKPRLGIEAAFSNKAMGGSEIADGQSSSARAFTIAIDYQPMTLQTFGVLGLGASGGLYPITGVTKTPFSVYSVGGQVRYQARFFREQPIVPTVAYHFDYFNYWLGSTGASGHVLAQGPSLGLWLLLSFLDVESASRFYSDYGIARSYLVAEARKTSADNGLVAFSGTSYFFGLRFEL